MQVTREVARKYGAKLSAAALMAASAVPAMAQDFDTVIADITTKVTSYGGALVVLAGVSVAFFVGIKYVKKIPRAA